MHYVHAWTDDLDITLRLTNGHVNLISGVNAAGFLLLKLCEVGLEY